MEGSVRRNIALKLKEPAARVSSPGPSSPSSRSTTQDSDQVTAVTGRFSLHQGKELRWDQRLNLIGRPVINPLLHICEVCDLPVLIYGRMKRCRHAFCRDCAKKAGGICPRCREADQTFEEASMGSVYVCCHGGERYNNKGCGRSYLSQRDLDAHVAYRHMDKSALPQQSVLNTAPLPQLTMPPFFHPPPPPPPRGGQPNEISRQGSVLRPFHPSSMFTVPSSAPNWPRPPGFS